MQNRYSTDTTIDYLKWFEQKGRAWTELIEIGGTIPSTSFVPNFLTLNRITTVELELEFPYANNPLKAPGIYLGDPKNFMDITAYWNIRALGAEIFFVPIPDEKRVLPTVDGYRKEHAQDRRAIIWARDEIAMGASKDLLNALSPDASTAHSDIWTVSSRLFQDPRIVLMGVSSKNNSILTPVTQTDRGASIEFVLPPKPLEETALLQQVMLNIQVMHGQLGLQEEAFKIPNIPDLSEFYGMTLMTSRFKWWHLRVQENYIALLT